MQHFCCFISQLLKKTTATVFILGDKILSPIHFEYKTFSKGYLVDDVFSNPLNRFLTLPGPTYWIGLFSQGGGAGKSMKELSETPCCYLEVIPCSHEKFRVEISKTGLYFGI